MGCTGIGCISIVVLIVVLFIGGFIVNSSQSPAEKNDDEAYAMVLCKGEVEDALKSPSSASFSEVSAVRTGHLFWTVTGAVDAENGFGAMIRNRFTCTMEVRESDGFTRTTLISLG